MDLPAARRPAAALALAVVVAAGCGSGDTGGALDSPGTPPLRPGATTLPADATVLTAELTGAEEVPGPGAAGGGGTARLVLTPDGKVCANLTTTKIDPATAAHVHTGATGVAGPVVITLPTPKDGRAEGCATTPTDPSALAQIKANPQAAYVNVHTAAQPAGAIRGQLQA
ncbi:MAG: CHRD domain-containing protein [Acidimicrobiales bacterium]